MSPATKAESEACRKLLEAFFKRHANDPLQLKARHALEALRAKGLSLSGKPGGWAAGIVYAVSCTGCGVPGVFNRDLEKAFGVSMSTVYKRAAAVRRVLPFARPGLLGQG